jgi:hypothetical protein
MAEVCQILDATTREIIANPMDMAIVLNQPRQLVL